MTKKRATLLAFLACLVATSSLATASLAATAAAYRVLIVDGTQTLASTMRVVGLAGGIKQSGVSDVAVLVAASLGPFDVPLHGWRQPEIPYDVILLVPRGVDDRTAPRIWVLVAGDPRANPLVAQAMGLLAGGVDRAFAGIASAAGPLDDLWAALAASYCVQEGWLR